MSKDSVFQLDEPQKLFRRLELAQQVFEELRVSDGLRVRVTDGARCRRAAHFVINPRLFVSPISPRELSLAWRRRITIAMAVWISISAPMSIFRAKTNTAIQFPITTRGTALRIFYFATG